MGQKTSFTQTEAITFTQAGGVPLLPQFIRDAIRTDGNARHHMIQSALAGTGIDEKDFIQKTKAPLAFVYGDKDGGINNDYIKSLKYSNLFGVFELKGGHTCFWDAADAFNKILSEFAAFCLKDQKAKASTQAITAAATE